MSNFTTTFGGSPVSPADIAYASYSFASNLTLYWPQFASGQTNVAARFMNLTATVGSLNVYMPDATLNSVGYDAIIYNAGSNTFNVVDYSGGAIATITAGQTYYLMLNSNTTQAGTWQTVQFGVGTGSASAAALAGSGLLAAAGLLEVNSPASLVSGDFTVSGSARGSLYVWNGGAGTITLPAASSVGNGFVFSVANNGSASLTISASDQIDGAATSSILQTQSCFIISTGTTWYTVGKGIQNTFAVTVLNLNVAGAADVTLTSAQAQNIIQQYTGALTGNINVKVPNTAQIYFCYNNTSGAYTLTVKTAAGTGIQVPQGGHSILYCDGTNVINAVTTTVGSNVILPVGSASSPTLTFQANLTSGLFSAGSNTVSTTANAYEVTRFSAAATSVNYWTMSATATGNALTLVASGSDTNIGINLTPKGTGTCTLVKLDSTAIGSGTPSTGAFTTLSASSTVSGTGFSTYLASPPAIGSGTPSTGAFSFLGAGAAVSGTYQLNVVQAGSNQAYFGSTGANSAAVFIDNAAGGQETDLTFMDAGTQKWSLFKQNTNQFAIYDRVNSKFFLQAVPAGNLLLGPAQNFTISQTGATSIGGALSVTGALSSKQTAKVWVNFDGTLAGPITPRASYNVSSITKNGTGDYTINFTTATADANYSFCASSAYGAASDANVPIAGGKDIAAAGNPATTTSFRMQTMTNTVVAFDCKFNSLVIFGN